METTSETKSKGGKLIALTFDDGPGPYTNRLLDGLAERGVAVTFFVLGDRAEIYTDTVQRIYREGHEVAQHSYNHPTLSTQSDSQITWQIQHTKEIINRVLGKNFTYLVRPPYGDYSQRVLSLLEAPAIIWSIDPLDWQDRNAYTVCNRIVSRAFDGAIVLAHDIHSTTVDGSLMAIDQLLAEGYEFVTVSELYRRRGVQMENGKLYYSCKPNGTDHGSVSAPTVSEQLPTDNGFEVTISAAPGAGIYYTTDGANPAVYGIAYTQPVRVANGTTLKICAAYDLNGGRSSVTYYTAQHNVNDPKIAVVDGAVVLTNPNQVGEIYYTTDGSLPRKDSRVYTEPIPCFDGVLKYCVLGDGICGNLRTIYVRKNGNLFWDVPTEAWYADAVDAVASLGLLRGTSEYCFSPNRDMTRAMFVTGMYRMMYEPKTDSECTFPDVANGLWYTDAVVWAAAQGIVFGYDDGSFRPQETISRQEMCVMLDRILQWLKIECGEAELKFADAGQIAPWAEDSVARVVDAGLMNGVENNCFAPENTATRAQVAAVFLRLYMLQAAN